MKTMILTKNEVGSLLTMADAIHSVELAYQIYVQNRLEQPQIVSVDIPKHHGELDIKTCYSKTDETISIKSASGYWNNGSDHGIPNLLATIILLDGKTGFPLCIMDGSLITGYRTGAAGGLSAKILARSDAKKVAVIGAGNQARMQIKAIAEVMPIDAISVWSPAIDEMNRYKHEIEKDLKLPVTICATSKEAVIDADIIVTATPAKYPMVQDDWVKQGAHIIAVGADTAGKQEIDTKLFKRAKVFVDSRSQCLELGETRNAVISGDLLPEGIHAELGEVILGTKVGRTSDQEVTIFDTTGMGIQDNTLATMLYKKALNLGIGITIDFLN
ncbi:MAG: ornithine cyclodeaminase family protein [Acetobacterium sp.]